MPKTLSPFIEAALSSKEVSVFTAIDLIFDSGSLRIWDGNYDLPVGGFTYLGAGAIMSISALEESTEIEAIGASITLSGIPSDYLSLALSEPYQGRPCRIYLGFLDESVSPPTAEYIEVFSGLMDQMNIEESGETAVINITAENELINLERITIRRFTGQDQKTRYPNDKGLDFVEDLQDKQIYWGRNAPRE